jgi:hypothetical protein
MSNPLLEKLIQDRDFLKEMMKGFKESDPQAYAELRLIEIESQIKMIQNQVIFKEIK